jgi:hypothetical protein
MSWLYMTNLKGHKTPKAYAPLPRTRPLALRMRADGFHESSYRFDSATQRLPYNSI